MQRQQKNKPIGVFPAPTITQLETLLDERQQADRRSRQRDIDFEERRRKERRSDSN